MPDKDDFDDVPELVTDELIEIPVPPVPKSTPPPLPKDDFLESINAFCNKYFGHAVPPRIPEHGYSETNQSHPYDMKIAGESRYSNIEKRMATIPSDPQVAAVVNDCYILAAQIAMEKKKPEAEPATFAGHDDEEIAGEGIEELGFDKDQ